MIFLVSSSIYYLSHSRLQIEFILPFNFVFIIRQEDTWKQLRKNISTCLDKNGRQRRHSIIFISNDATRISQNRLLIYISLRCFIIYRIPKKQRIAREILILYIFLLLFCKSWSILWKLDELLNFSWIFVNYTIRCFLLCFVRVDPLQAFTNVGFCLRNFYLKFLRGIYIYSYRKFVTCVSYNGSPYSAYVTQQI